MRKDFSTFPSVKPEIRQETPYRTLKRPHIAEHGPYCRAEGGKPYPGNVEDKACAHIKRHIECRQTGCFPFLDFGECHGLAFITHKKQRGHGFFQRYSFQVRGKRRPHQDMPRINHKGYGGDKQYRQRGRPQVDRCKFGAAGKVHPRHQQHFQPTHTFLPACIPSINAQGKSPISMGELSLMPRMNSSRGEAVCVMLMFIYEETGRYHTQAECF